MKSIKEDFIKIFGKNEAKNIEEAAQSHGNGINNGNIGSDPFKWALLICIGYQCMEIERYRKHHGIKTSWKKLKSWIKKHGELDTHDGDFDYLSLFAGVYNEYMPKKEEKNV